MVQFQGADEFFETAAQGGQAFRFEDIDGIGPATSKKIQSVRGVNAPTDVKDMSADELADKAGITRNRASKAIQGAGGNPSVSKTSSNTGSVSAAGIRTRQGDFWVEFSEMDRARARNDARSRSPEAVKADENQRAPITTNLETWQENPGRWDYPGVDTPTQDPGVRPKDYKAGGEFETSEFDEKGRAEYDDEQQETFPRKKDAASGKSNFILETGEDRIPASDVVDRQDFDPFGLEAEARDISISPDEAIRGVAAVSPNALGGNFMTEGERAPSNLDDPPEDVLEQQGLELTDDRDRDSQLLDFGMDTDATQHREARTAEEQATSFGVDDRSEATRGTSETDSGEQGGLERFGGGTRENETLF